MKIKKMIPCLTSILAFAALPAFASGTDAVAKRVGPVSYYGALQTSSGKIIGAKNNQEAVVRGMSMFWSDATGLPYYDKTVISWAVENLKIDVFRFAMGINYYDSDGGTKNGLSTGYSYASAPDGYKAIIDKMVEAAVENDVYIILDWHSHRADTEQAIATAFFKEMAEKYKNVPNVIFEIFNEPVHQGWGAVQSYANAVIPGIRASSQNLVLVGTPSWSQLPQYGGVSGTNIGYVFHFYAGTHSVGQYGSRITTAKNSGNPVFITEWGTVSADGKGNANSSETANWTSFMDQNNISNCNWSLRQVGTDETSAIFAGSEELTTKAELDAAKYSASGSIVKAYLQKNARSWNDSLTKGKHNGSCSFNHTTASELDGQISTLKPGCTYSSSNEKVVSGTGAIVGAGYSILTGNDGSETVVTITSVPRQTVPNFKELTCNYGGTCSTNRTLDYSGSGNKEWIVTIDAKTLEGANFTLKSLDPSTVTVKTATCTSASCSNAQKGKQVLMYEFKNFGSAKIVATAPAVAGYQAVNDTITVTFNKGTNRIANNFKDTKLAFGAIAEKLLPDTTMLHTPVTYTFNGKPTSDYVTKNGNALIAGNQNAIVQITANAPETEIYREFQKTITVIVGDSALAVNRPEFEETHLVSTNRDLPLNATILNNQLNIGCDKAGDIQVDIFDLMGQKVMSKTLSSHNASMSLAKVPTGSYLVVISQDLKQLNIKWNKAK